IVVIITDDMGFSDIAPYGGEIATPNLDRLAAAGVKFSQFYNCGKCEPSRAALLSGHQWWTKNPQVAIRKDSPNIGEVLRGAGYRNMMVGKWHVDGHPFERGFDRHFGFMGGGTDSFLGDSSFTLDGQPWPVPTKDFYATTALTDHAVRFIREENKAHADQPFFLYLAYNAPHAPILAPAAEVAKYRGKYRKGWDVIRRERFEKQKSLGLAGPGWNFPARPANIPAWDSLDAKAQDFEDLRMATYAAMVDCVDQGVGRVLQTLDELKVRENTLVIFLNDNGASPNDRVRRGEFGTPGTTWNTGVAWAHVSNTPFKHYKRAQHGGGITAPLIASWPAAIRPRAAFEDQPCHISDLLPTLIDVAGTSYPADFGGKAHPPLPGRSLAPVLKNSATLPPRPLHFGLFNNLALIDRDWKIVTAYSEPWQLYDLAHDRTETRDLARERPEKLRELLALQQAFHAQPDVALRLQAGEREPEYAAIYKSDGTKGPGARENVVDADFALLLAKAHAQGRQLSEAELTDLRKQADATRSANPDGQPAPKKRGKKQ
ncbi:MAG: Arylsulfatase precursor, partial [Verrucomicrobiota bacterium]